MLTDELLFNRTRLPLEEFARCLPFIGEFTWAPSVRARIWQRLIDDMGMPTSAQALEPLGTLLLSMSTAQINTLNFSDANAIDTLAVLGALQSWTNEQVTALAERVRQTYARSASKWIASDLAAMGRVLCAMTTEIDDHVSTASFATAIVAIGEMRQCSPLALAAMARRAVHIYNDTTHWTPSTVRTLGIIVAG
jgi:hypothetical protein